MLWGEFIGGIGLFIFGMLQFEQAIKQLGGKTIKRVLQHYTDKVRKGISMGVGMTALAQSSTVVSLIVVGFVGAELISLHSGMSVIVGANLGSTFTGWMIALIGFKVDIFSLAFYFVGVGGFGLFLTNEFSKRNGVWKLLLGFGLLFLGLNFLKESVAVLTTQVDISLFANIGLWTAILIGLLMALVMQTTAAATVVLLSALQAHLISFELAASIMIGANLGSAFSTSIMGSLSTGGKSRVKKQLMIGHALFNIVSAILMVILLPGVLKLIGVIVKSGDPIISLTIFHTLFNLIGVICLTPLIGTYTKWISRVMSIKNKNFSLNIYQVATTMPEEVLVALENDLDLLRERVYKFIRSCFGIHNESLNEKLELPVEKKLHGWKLFLKKVIDRGNTILGHRSEEILHYHPDPLIDRIKEYQSIKEIETALYTFIIRLPKEEFINGFIKKLNSIQDRIYSLVDVAKIIKDNMNHIERIEYIDEPHILEYWSHLCNQIEQVISIEAEGTSPNAYADLEEGSLYDFLQEQMLLKKKDEEGLSNEDIAEILNMSRHALNVINLLKQEKLTHLST